MLIRTIANASLALLMTVSYRGTAMEETLVSLESSRNNYEIILREIEELTARIHREVDQVLEAYKRDTAEYHRRMGIQKRGMLGIGETRKVDAHAKVGAHAGKDRDKEEKKEKEALRPTRVNLEGEHKEKIKKIGEELFQNIKIEGKESIEQKDAEKISETIIQKLKDSKIDLPPKSIKAMVENVLLNTYSEKISGEKAKLISALISNKVEEIWEACGQNKFKGNGEITKLSNEISSFLATQNLCQIVDFLKQETIIKRNNPRNGAPAPVDPCAPHKRLAEYDALKGQPNKGDLDQVIKNAGIENLFDRNPDGLQAMQERINKLLLSKGFRRFASLSTATSTEPSLFLINQLRNNKTREDLETKLSKLENETEAFAKRKKQEDVHRKLTASPLPVAQQGNISSEKISMFVGRQQYHINNMSSVYSFRNVNFDRNACNTLINSQRTGLLLGKPFKEEGLRVFMKVYRLEYKEKMNNRRNVNHREISAENKYYHQITKEEDAKRLQKLSQEGYEFWLFDNNFFFAIHKDPEKPVFSFNNGVVLGATFNKIPDARRLIENSMHPLVAW